MDAGWTTPSGQFILSWAVFSPVFFLLFSFLPLGCLSFIERNVPLSECFHVFMVERLRARNPSSPGRDGRRPLISERRPWCPRHGGCHGGCRPHPPETQPEAPRPCTSGAHLPLVLRSVGVAPRGPFHLLPGLTRVSPAPWVTWPAWDRRAVALLVVPKRCRGTGTQSLRLRVQTEGWPEPAVWPGSPEQTLSHPGWRGAGEGQSAGASWKRRPLRSLSPAR